MCLKHLLFAALLAPLPLAAAPQANSLHVIKNKPLPQYMLVLAAESGTCKGDECVLEGVPHAIYFSDRPYRIAGHLSLEDIAKIWYDKFNYFKENPPGAVLSILDKHGQIAVTASVLSFKIIGHTATLKLKILEGEAPENFGSASLFVDNILSDGKYPY